MNFKECLELTKQSLVTDLACTMSDFEQEGIHIVEARELEGRRKFPFRNPSLTAASFGKGVVISCNAERLPVVREDLGSKTTNAIMGAPALAEMQRIVTPDNQFMGGPDLKHLCGSDTLKMTEPPASVEIVVIRDPAEIQSLYGDPRFSYALGNAYQLEKPTVMVTRAVCNGKTIGMAGVSADSDSMYQIGINVEPEWQGQGVAGALVSLLTKLVLDEGKVPYYSTWINNLASRRLALSVGYKPAWVELYALFNE